MAQGTIKSIMRDRGFGFISGQDGKEVFFHRTGLQGLQFDNLQEGAAVEYDLENGPKGPRAVNVKQAG